MTLDDPNLTPDQQAALLACMGQLTRGMRRRCECRRYSVEPDGTGLEFVRCLDCGFTVIRSSDTSIPE